MTKTPHFSMHFLTPNQSHKEITYNESLLLIDLLLSGSVIDIDLNQAPSNVDNGNLYIIGNNPQDDWVGKNNNLVYFFQGWRFIKPKTGISFFVISKNALYRFIDSDWKRVD